MGDFNNMMDSKLDRSQDRSRIEWMAGYGGLDV